MDFNKFSANRYFYSYVKNVYAKESIYNEFKEYVESHTQNDEHVTFLAAIEVKMVVESWQGKTLYCAEGDGYIASRLDGCTLDKNNPDYDKILLSMAYGKYGFAITLNVTDSKLTKSDSNYGGYSEVYNLIEHDGKTYLCEGSYFDENNTYGWITFEDDQVLWHEIHDNYKVEFITVWRMQTSVNE